jgi:hypothetical protein
MTKVDYTCSSDQLTTVQFFRVCLVHGKIESLVEIGTMWQKSWKFMCVGKFWCDGKVESLKKKFRTKLGLREEDILQLTSQMFTSLWLFSAWLSILG